jgi:hypothetical protein
MLFVFIMRLVSCAQPKIEAEMFDGFCKKKLNIPKIF